MKQTESLLILTAEDINRPDPEQSSEKSSQSESGDNHPHQRKRGQVADKSSAPHKWMLSYRNISNALITHFLNLQFKDTWCKKKEWEAFLKGKITKDQFKSMWHVDHVNLMWCDSAVYVPDHASTKAMILYQNHDDLWEGGHFDIKQTLSMIWKFYWWSGMVQTV